MLNQRLKDLIKIASLNEAIIRKIMGYIERGRAEIKTYAKGVAPERARTKRGGFN